MKTLNFQSLPTILMFLLPTLVFAQKDEGDKAFERLEYQKAIKAYEKHLAGNNDPKAARNLADCYRLTDRNDLAEHWYAKAAAAPSPAPETTLLYAMTLMANGKSAEACRWAEIYLKEVPGDQRGASLRKTCLDVVGIAPAAGVSVAPWPGNTAEGADFAPAFWGEELVFTSERDEGGRKNPWTGRPFTRLFRSPLDGSNPQPLEGKGINSKFHDGAAAFAPGGAKMYFTRTTQGKKSRRDELNLQIIAAENEDDKWKTEEDAFPWNSPEFSNGHPTLSPDGNLMVFASNRPGGSGGMDLYATRWESAKESNGAGHWSTPENLGPGINTPGSESFPTLLADGSLIFSSDGLPGLGSLDLFRATPNARRWASPQNLGAPFNSNRDDFGLCSRDDLESGFFSSNRDQVEGLDKIWAFQREAKPSAITGLVLDEESRLPLPGVVVSATNLSSGETRRDTTGDDGRFVFPGVAPGQTFKVEGSKNGIGTNTETVAAKGENTYVELLHNDPRFTLRGMALKSGTQIPVEGVEVKLLNVTSGKEELTQTDAAGNFTFQLNQNSDFRITGAKDGCFTTVSEASTKGLRRSQTFYVKLYLNIEEIVIGKEIILKDREIGGYKISDILYDFNESKIRPDAARELDKLAALLKNTPEIGKIELSSHTDSRGSSKYNLPLSEKRAAAAVAYLVSKGVEKSRLSAKGYGESRLLNRCDDGVTCSEEEHQRNRRTEIKVLSVL